MSSTTATGAAPALPTTSPGAGRLRWLLGDTMVMAGRNLAHVRQIPEKLIDATIQPLMFVLLFAFVFGEVISVPGGGDYHEYLIGGVLVQTLAFGIMGPGTSIATDLREGILDRFRSLPALRPAFLFGHLLAEFAASMLAITIMVISGFVVGWSIHSSPLEALGGFGLLALLAISMLWLGTLVGVIGRSPDVVTGIGFLIVFPLTFVAGTFVPVAGLPDGLRQFAEYNPVSTWAAGVRTLFGNPTAIPADAAWPLQHPVLCSVLWCLGLIAVLVPVTMAAFRRRTMG